jgi:thioredoxin 1
MSGTDDLEELRERRREELKRRLAGEDADDRDAASPNDAAPDDPIHVEGPDHLAEVVGRYGVVLVDFYADWCGPCKMLDPVVADIAAETPAAVTKVDVDALGGLAGQYGVQGVPTLVLFSDGEAVERVVGARGKAELADMVASHV